jgi:hypothetical protein
MNGYMEETTNYLEESKTFDVTDSVTTKPVGVTTPTTCREGVAIQREGASQRRRSPACGFLAQFAGAALRVISHKAT